MWQGMSSDAGKHGASPDAKGNIARLIRSSPVAGLCYDTPSIEVVLFPVDTPDKTLWVLSEDFYQEKCPSKPLVKRFSRNFYFLYAFIQDKSALTRFLGVIASENGDSGGLVIHKD